MRAILPYDFWISPIVVSRKSIATKTNAVSERAKWQFYYVIYATTG